MTLTQRTGVSFLVVLALACATAAFVLETRAERQSTMAILSRTYELTTDIAALERCLSERHREITLLAQTFGGDERMGIDREVLDGVTSSLGQCAAVTQSLARGEKDISALALETLAQETRKLIEDWTFVVTQLGVNHVAALQRQATVADPRAVRLLEEALPKARQTAGGELDRARSQFEEHALRADRAMLGLLFGAAAVVMLVTLALMFRVLRGLRGLSEAMLHFGRGELDHRVHLGGNDELSDVATRINGMAEQLSANQLLLRARAMELQRSLEQLKDAQAVVVQQEKLAALGGLVAGVAHEVNTPIGVAVTSGTLIEDHIRKLEIHAEQGTATRRILRDVLLEMRAALEPMLANLHRAAQLVQSFKQIAVDRSQVSTRKVLLSDLLRSITQTLAPMMRKHRCEPMTVVEGDAAMVIAAGEFEQVVTNLVVNACIHGYAEEASEGTGRRPVHLRVCLAHDKLEVTIRDEGQGMSKEVAARVFEPFFTTKRSRGGTGLGMHIVHQLVAERFRGEIELKTAPGEGTAWILTMPVPTDALHLALDEAEERALA
jgi:signal transduction histidine kinase